MVHDRRSTNDIKQFISYSNEINQIEDPNIRNTFQFNRSSVVQSIRMLRIGDFLKK